MPVLVAEAVGGKHLEKQISIFEYSHKKPVSGLALLLFPFPPTLFAGNLNCRHEEAAAHGPGAKTSCQIKCHNE